MTGSGRVSGKIEDITTRDRIIEACLTLFNTRGLVGSPVTKICQKAGIMPGNLTYYFPKKKDILLEIERRFEQEISALQNEVMEQTMQAGEVTAYGTAQMLVRILRIIWKYRFFYTSIMSVQGLDPAIRTKFRYMERKVQSGTAQLIQKAIDFGRVRELRYPNSVPVFAENLWYIFWSSVYFQQLRAGDSNVSENEIIYHCAMHCAAFLEDHQSPEFAAELCAALHRECLGGTE